MRTTALLIHNMFAAALLVSSLVSLAYASEQIPFEISDKPVLVIPVLEIEPLIVSGPSNNRIDLVFLSDGYLIEERAKFFADAKFLAEDISANQTFNTVRPLLNFWAAFTPSKESGVGTDGNTLDTPYGLYRDGTELRGVWCNNTDAARAACESMGDRCDYPIALGNSPLYGGSGGYPTVITASYANGPLVLRHELGHSIIRVGEEYDGGVIRGYFGVNAFHDLSEPVPWSHWLTDSSQSSLPSVTSRSPARSPRVERSVMPLQDYAWTMLNISSSWTMNFTSSGTYARYIVRFSLSGLPEAKDLTIKLDDKDLHWVPRKNIGLDRWHYDIHRNETLSDGQHRVGFVLNSQDLEGSAQLCSVEILEFGTEEEFISTPGYYGIYPTYSDKNETAYRPTNEDCLMRVVTTPNFCSVCKEDLWRRLLQGIYLIDSITADCVQTSTNATLEAHLVPLAQFRATDNQVHAKEKYIIRWSKDGESRSEFDDLNRIEVNGDEAVGNWLVKVRFETDEVRQDPDELLQDALLYEVASPLCDT